MVVGLSASTPFFQEFHAVLHDESLGLLMRPMNDLAVVEGLKQEEVAAARAGVTAGSVLVAVNGMDVSTGGFERAIGLVKKAGRPVRLGFRRLHAVLDPGIPKRRMWQGYLFARFSAGRSWTGRFYVLREDGELRAYAGKECYEHVEELRVAVGGSVRSSERDVGEAARASGDLGDDGRGSLGPRAFAVPVLLNAEATMRWEFFKAESLESSRDWVAALTTLAVAAKVSSGAVITTSAAVGASVRKRSVEQQGYLWLKKMISAGSKTSEGAAASAALELATRLEPWRRRWFALVSYADGRRELVWYAAPPDDESEVPNGSCALDDDDASIVFEDRREFEVNKILRLRADEDADVWVRALLGQAGATDEDSRHKRLGALSLATVLRSPETAFSLLVPVDRYGGVDRDEWKAVAGRYLPLLCDAYVADIIFDALSAPDEFLLQEDEDPSATSAARTHHHHHHHHHDKHHHHHQEQDEVVVFGAKYARTTAKRLSLDAGARVSELLYEGVNSGNKDRAPRGDLETSRRRAEPITSRDRRLRYDAFRNYCRALGAACAKDAAWDDLRARLGVEELEILVLKDEARVDDQPATAYLTDRHLMVHASRANLVKVVSLASVDAVSPVDETLVLSLDQPDVFTIPLVGASRDDLSDSSSVATKPLGDYPGGGKPFAGTTQHTPPPKLSAPSSSSSSSSERAFWEAFLYGSGVADEEEEDDEDTTTTTTTATTTATLAHFFCAHSRTTYPPLPLLESTVSIDLLLLLLLRFSLRRRGTVVSLYCLPSAPHLLVDDVGLSYLF